MAIVRTEASYRPALKADQKSADELPPPACSRIAAPVPRIVVKSIQDRPIEPDPSLCEGCRGCLSFIVLRHHEENNHYSLCRRRQLVSRLSGCTRKRELSED